MLVTLTPLMRSPVNPESTVTSNSIGTEAPLEISPRSYVTLLSANKKETSVETKVNSAGSKSVSTTFIAVPGPVFATLIV